MSGSESSWIILCDQSRRICCPAVEPGDELLFLACLSSDPRTIEDMAQAWMRHCPEQPLLDMKWIPLAEFDSSSHPGRVWMWIDLSQCSFAWHGCDGQPLDPGAYAMTPHSVERKSQVKLSRAQKKRDKKRGVDRLKPLTTSDSVWLNIPPWWLRAQPTQFPGFDGCIQRPDSPVVHYEPFEFRSVLYGKPLAQFIAQHVRLAVTQDTHGSAASTLTAMEGGGPTFERGDDNDDDEVDEQDSMQHSILKAIRRIHVNWLMTPHGQLNNLLPREYLHRYRPWKDRELDHRRTQWSATRKPPLPVSKSSHLFRNGPMGTEEVVLYFDMCREAITMAWRWVDDDPTIGCEQLITDVERFIDGWLAAEVPDSPGSTARQLIDAERQLLPHLASNEPIDCNCPLCRLQSQNPELFGPAFSICDGYHLEMEDEFAFSLTADREEWEETRELWNDDWTPTNMSTDNDDGDDDDEGGKKLSLAATRPLTAEAAVGAGNDDSTIWKSSWINPNARSPQLSLLAIGTRLSEVITELQEMSAPQSVLDSLNSAFDELGRAIRMWLVETAAGSSCATSLDQVVETMVSELEKVAMQFPALTAQSADLQSLVHDWRRQLT